MVHGNSESSRAWNQWVPHLAGRYRVVRPDLPGFGASPEPEGYGWSASELAGDLRLFLDALGIEQCHLIGAKYGGSVAMLCAAEHPQRLRSLCLFGSPVRGSGTGNADLIRHKGVRQWAAETMRARLGSAAPRRRSGGGPTSSWARRARAPRSLPQRPASTWSWSRCCRASPRPP
jgi:pimeloyl-ACP methyl ester carboxylesterase